ncbi:hypothetical protein F5884DRAFT_377021 [Xylogone sp. PMI_703]|nr:hypothetical protein F5884DRAFT_377021 [Xylogone sp. PMI_703]
MAEYWKSTPKYWCKHCKVYVRDTKLEKTNHEATPRHQGNLKRFLRDLHRGHEKEEKDRERAKAEIARLNGLTGPAVGSSSESSFGRGPTPSAPKPQATASQRKQQLAQLAEMGINIPDEFRGEMAMAGEWQVTSERIVEPAGQQKNPDAIGFGVRKRQVEEDEEPMMEVKKKKWGSTFKTVPSQENADDLDALLENATRKGKENAPKAEIKEEIETKIKTEPDTLPTVSSTKFEPIGEVDQKPFSIKKEPSEHDTLLPTVNGATEENPQQEDISATNPPEILFKKRKVKNIRQK